MTDTACRQCGGKGKFEVIETELSTPKTTPPFYEIGSKQVELTCGCCNGRGKDCGCSARAA